MFKGEILDRGEQPVVAPEAPATDEPSRKPRRIGKPAGAEGSEKPKARTVKARPEATATETPAAPEAKAPAKRVRKAGTTDAAAN